MLGLSLCVWHLDRTIYVPGKERIRSFAWGMTVVPGSWDEAHDWRPKSTVESDFDLPLLYMSKASFHPVLCDWADMRDCCPWRSGAFPLEVVTDVTHWTVKHTYFKTEILSRGSSTCISLKPPCICSYLVPEYFCKLLPKYYYFLSYFRPSILGEKGSGK